KDKSPPSPRLRRDSLRFRLTTRAKTGGKGIRTPDFQLAKLALYQLSYAPAIGTAECRLRIADFNPENFRGCVPACLSEQVAVFVECRTPSKSPGQLTRQ